MASVNKQRSPGEGGAGDLEKGQGETSVAELLGDLPPPAGSSGAAEASEPAEAAPRSPVAAYEKELRDRLTTGMPPPKSSRRRVFETLGVLLVVGGLIGGAMALRHGDRDERRQEEAARFVAAAANGLARDTRSAYDATAEALEAALGLAPERGDAKAMLAQALATLSTTYGTGRADRVRALELLATADGDHPAALEARWLLARGEAASAAGEGGEAGEIERIEEEILAAAAAGAPAPIQSLAGAILLERGESAEAIERFNAAMQGMPAHVPTLMRIADYYRARREFAEAARYYDLVLAVAEDHVGALLGAAEARLALRQDEKALAASLADLRRVRGEEALPRGMVHRRHLVEASLHLALGDRKAARASLSALPGGLPPPELARQVVEAWLWAGAPERAMAMFDTFLGAPDSDVRHREAWALALLARRDFRRVTGLHAASGERDLRVLQGIAWFHLGDHAKARTTLRSATLRGKLPVEALIHLSWIDGRAGRVAQARSSLERFARGPRARTSGSLAYAELARRAGDLRGAEEVLVQALERAPHAADLHWELGNLRHVQGRLDDAAAAWTEAIELNRYHAPALDALARLHLDRGELEQARARWEALLEHHPRSTGALAGVALVQGLEGERERALRAFDFAAEAGARNGPDRAAPSWARARLALAAGDYREAATWLARAVQRSPRDGQLWAELGEARLAAGDAKGAGAAFLRAGRERPGWQQPWIGRARALTAEGRGVLAARQLRQILDDLGREGPGWLRAAAHAALAEALLSQGKGFAPAAREEAERALAASDAEGLAHLTLARALDDLGDPASAAAHHQRAQELWPDLPPVVLAWANHLLAKGEEEEAAEAFERYLDLAPRAPQAREARRALTSLRR